MSTRKKIAIGALILFAVIVLAALILVPMLINVDRYRPQIVERIRAETGKRAELGRLTLTLFPSVAIRADDLTLANPEGFPEGRFAIAKRIDVLVDAQALWHRQIVIKSLEIIDPQINLLVKPGDQWNFENLARSSPIKKASFANSSSFSLGVISDVRIVNGQLSAAKISPSGEVESPFVAVHGFSCHLNQVDLTAFGVAVSESLERPPYIRIARSLEWGPVTAYAASLVAQPAAQGEFKAEELRFQTLNFAEVKSKMRIYQKEVFFDDLGFDLYGGNAGGVVNFNFAGAQPHFNVKAQWKDLDVAKILADLPGSKVWMNGKLQGNVDLDGVMTQSPDPLEELRAIGRLSVRNGNLPMVQLDKNMLDLAKLSNIGAAKGDPRSFSSIIADFNIANERIVSRKIIIVGNGVSAEGSGSTTLAGNGSLDYHGVASFAAGTNQLTNIIAGFSGGKLSGGRLILPFSVGGTPRFPKFTMKQSGAENFGNLGNLVGGKATQAPNALAGQQQKPANLIQGLADAFKKKKNK